MRSLRGEISWAPVLGGYIQGLTWDRAYRLSPREVFALLEWARDRRVDEIRTIIGKVRG